MLSKNALYQIKTVVEEVVERKLEEKLDEKLEKKLEEKLNKKFDEKLKPIHKKLSKLQKDLDTTIRFFDRDIIDHKHRIVRTENHLHITPPASL